jgi:hypothetical protein
MYSIIFQIKLNVVNFTPMTVSNFFKQWVGGIGIAYQHLDNGGGSFLDVDEVARRGSRCRLSRK